MSQPLQRRARVADVQPGAQQAAGAAAADTVSVIVPVHNGAAFLAETLRAVAAQTHAPVELILVDDESTDDSVTVAQASGVPFKLLRQRNAGVSRARNAGLAAAQGKYVCFLDQDDVWYPEHLARQLAVFAEHPDTGAVFSPCQHWYPGAAGFATPPQALPARPGLDTNPDFTGWVYHQFLRNCWALTSATLIRRQAVLDCGGFDDTLPFSEDWDLWLRLARQVRFANLNWPPVLYRQHAVQGSRKARPVDYRCRLLLANAEQHGLASRDGRHVLRAEFQCMIAQYEADFGYTHLQCGDAALGVRTLLRAWRRHPTTGRPLALAVAAMLGWRPGGGVPTSGTPAPRP